jgi:hypothetical protein
MSEIGTNDINDGDILSSTRQENGVNNSVRFHYTLPSGRDICSEWIGEEQRKQALMLWLDAVRGQIVEDVKATQREKVGTGPRKKPSPELIVPAGTIDQVQDVFPDPAFPRKTVNQSTDTGNVELYLTSQLEKARNRKDYAAGALESAQTEYNEASAELSKIRKLVAALAAED